MPFKVRFEDSTLREFFLRAAASLVAGSSRRTVSMGRGEDGAEAISSCPPHTLPSTRWDAMSPTGFDSHKLSVAPMLDCTDSHFRRLCRLMSSKVHLWTEMVNQDAVLYAHKTRPDLLHHGDEEHPMTCQLGGADPTRLALASEICIDEYGYNEVNLNCGCPSAKVVGKHEQDKRFGASLMTQPEHVGECLRRMKEAVGGVPVTLKHRLGVRFGSREKYDEDAECDSYSFVSSFVDTVSSLSGCEHFVVHARCAVLGGLSTTANRNIPPLRHQEVHQLADDFPHLSFSLNGGIESIDKAIKHLQSGKLRGVMMGRAVYKNPAILADVDRLVYGVEKHWYERMQGEKEVVAKWPKDGWREHEKFGRRSFFQIDESHEETTSSMGSGTTSSIGNGTTSSAGINPPCITRRDVLRRFALYGDAVLRDKLDELRKHPRALGEARGLAKALSGMSHGVCAGGRFKRDLEFSLQGWSRRLLDGEDAEGLSFSELVDLCVNGLGDEGITDMETPMCEMLESEKRKAKSFAKAREILCDGNGENWCKGSRED